MKVHAAVLIGLAMLVSCDPREAPLAAVPAAPPAPAILPEAGIPAGARRMKVAWRMKLPGAIRCDRDVAIKDPSALEALFRESCDGQQTRLHLKWNPVRFDRQMALVTARRDRSPAASREIRDVWKTATEVLVEVRVGSGKPGAVYPAVLVNPKSGVVVERSDLPVRFVTLPDEEEQARK